MYGVAYKGSDNNIYAQAGDGDSDEMTKIVKYNTSGSWLTRGLKWTQNREKLALLRIYFIQRPSMVQRPLQEQPCPPLWMIKGLPIIMVAGPGKPAHPRPMYAIHSFGSP